jgi:hypothetical protein
VNIKEYISSGVLESYLLGAASSQEKQEVECLSQIYPEIKRELDDQSKSLETYLSAEAVTPSTYLRDKIMSQVDHLTQKENDKDIVVQKESENRKQNPYIYWVAAASLLFIIFGYYHFNSKLGDKEKELSVFKHTMDQLKNQVLAFEVRQTDLEDQLALLKNADNKLVRLKGTEAHPEAAALVCWNKTSREVYVAPGNMPPPAAGKQYQLWAIVSGKPVDLGLIDTGALKDHFKKVGAIENAEAFAITLENKGGSADPHLDQLIVIGNI